MKFVIAKDKFLELIGKLQSIIAAKPSVPVLANILVEAANDELILTATDLIVGMRCFTEAKILSEGSVTLPAKLLFQLIREVPSIQLEAHTSPQHICSITAGASHFKMHGMSCEEFPALPDLIGAPQVKIPQSQLKELLYRVAFTVSREENRFALSGVFCQISGGKITFIGTDGKRLAKAQAKVACDPSFHSTCILPLKAVDEVIKLCNEKESSEATLYLIKDKGAFEINHSVLITKLLVGDYPDVEQVIPKKTTVSLSLHREELISLLRQISLFASETTHSVRFTFTSGDLTITANTVKIGEGKVSMPVNYEGQKLEIAFNPGYFLDILRHSRDETIELALIDSFNPGVITDSSSALYILMPMRLNEA
ncbi:MAG: DNA polymerase III subunit beta [Verrucomicrobia bacterium]|nr:DNA polymerase III subunit beta [Verrucomicrobiota bacterium]